jgi:hypothetical protein
MIPMTAVDGYALKAVAVMGAGLLTGAVITGLANLLQKLLLDFPAFLLPTLLIQLILKDRQFIAVYLHKRIPPTLKFKNFSLVSNGICLLREFRIA